MRSRWLPHTFSCAQVPNNPPCHTSSFSIEANSFLTFTQYSESEELWQSVNFPYPGSEYVPAMDLSIDEFVEFGRGGGGVGDILQRCQLRAMIVERRERTCRSTGCAPSRIPPPQSYSLRRSPHHAYHRRW